MPKLDLSKAIRIKGPSGEISALKGVGFSWSIPDSSRVAYRFWRFELITASATNFYHGIGDIQFYERLGGQSIAKRLVGGVGEATASNSVDLLGATNQNPFLYWATSFGNGVNRNATFEFDEEVSLSSFQIQAPESSSAATYTPVGFNLYGSNDGTNFTLVETYDDNGVNYAPGEKRTHEVPDALPLPALTNYLSRSHVIHGRNPGINVKQAATYVVGQKGAGIYNRKSQTFIIYDGA